MALVCGAGNPIVTAKRIRVETGLKALERLKKVHIRIPSKYIMVIDFV
jgi:hypothetical protein